MTTIQVVLHDGMSFTANLESYNADDVTGKLNNPQTIMVNIGGAIIHKNAIKMIVPVTMEQDIVE